MDYNVNYVVQQASDMLKKTGRRDLRFCSIGCGDGRFDKRALLGLFEKNPDLKVHYIGIDINEFSCQKAKTLLGSLENVDVEIHVANVEEFESDELIRACDLVIAVHSLYYLASLNKGLSTGLALLKPTGIPLKLSTLIMQCVFCPQD